MGVDPGREIIWMVDSRKVLSQFPEDVRQETGHALRIAQQYGKHDCAKPLGGDLSGVMEIVSNSENGNTYRSVYTAKLEDYLYVLHCFEKKSKRGIATPKSELDVIRKRFKAAKVHNAEIVQKRKADQTEAEKAKKRVLV
jgi:phage-related protein